MVDAHAWEIIVGLVGLILALVGFIWVHMGVRRIDALEKRVDRIDDPKDGIMASADNSLLQRIHNQASRLTEHGEQLAALEAKVDNLRDPGE